MARVYLSLGSNIDPAANLMLAIRELRWRFGDLDMSEVYESEAVGFDGADFFNMVVGFDTGETPQGVVWQVELIHEFVGRDRESGRFSSRPLDIDLLLYGDLVMDEPKMKLPRCDVLDYSFVLRPLAEIAPDLRHPVTGKTMNEHWQEFDPTSHPLRRVRVIL